MRDSVDKTTPRGRAQRLGNATTTCTTQERRQRKERTALGALPRLLTPTAHQEPAAYLVWAGSVDGAGAGAARVTLCTLRSGRRARALAPGKGGCKWVLVGRSDTCYRDGGCTKHPHDRTSVLLPTMLWVRHPARRSGTAWQGRKAAFWCTVTCTGSQNIGGPGTVSSGAVLGRALSFSFSLEARSEPARWSRLRGVRGAPCKERKLAGSGSTQHGARVVWLAGAIAFWQHVDTGSTRGAYADYNQVGSQSHKTTNSHDANQGRGGCTFHSG